MIINWEEFDISMKNTKYPLVLIKKFFSSYYLISDNYASIMLRYIIKNNIDTFYKYPFFILSKNLHTMKYNETANILETLYELMKIKLQLINKLKIWFMIYKNKFFWNKDVENQIKDLYRMKEIIKANFDTSKGGISFGMKMIPIIKSNDIQSRTETLESLAGRLSNIYKIMGKDFFKKIEIPIFSINEFYELDNNEIIKYSNFVYMKSVEIITQTIEIFEEYNMISLKFNNLINPYCVEIVEDTVSNDDIEDLTNFFS